MSTSFLGFQNGMKIILMQHRRRSPVEVKQFSVRIQNKRFSGSMFQGHNGVLSVFANNHIRNVAFPQKIIVYCLVIPYLACYTRKNTDKNQAHLLKVGDDGRSVTKSRSGAKDPSSSTTPAIFFAKDILNPANIH